MIEIRNVSKSLGSTSVLKSLSVTINDGEVFGLVGINGAGKSTLLRCLSGVYSVDSGHILIDGEDVFDNPKIKKDIFFLADNPYYTQTSSIKTILKFYNTFYNVDMEKFKSLINKFKLDYDKPINNFSKGMRRQLFIALAIAIAPKYLFLDEAFDGLDPLARLEFKRSIAQMLENHQTTIIISSHSLRELEDICDSYGILDAGKIQNSGNIEAKRDKYHKYQLAFPTEKTKEDFAGLNVLSFNKMGRIIKIVVVGEEEECDLLIEKMNPLVVDKIAIDFEELFIIEVEAGGYKYHE